MQDRIIRIGDMARMLGMTQYELRKRGTPPEEGVEDNRSDLDRLLEPQFVDERTGYRYYTESQVDAYIDAVSKL